MGFLFTRLGRYLVRQTVLSIGLTLAGVIVTVLLIDLVDQLRTLSGRTPLALVSAVYLTMLKTPLLIEQTLPFVVLVGTMIAMVRLNRRSELIAMRAAGVSASRFLTPSAAIAVGLGLLSTMALDPVASTLYQLYQARANELLATSAETTPRHDVWLRQGDGAQQIVIHANVADPRDGALTDATFLVFDVQNDSSLKFSRRIRARRADLHPGFWQLRDVTEAVAGAKPETYQQLALPTALRQQALQDRVVDPSTLSFWRLPRFLTESRQAGLAPLRYELRWHALLSAPVFLLAMAAIGAVFCLRLPRLGGMGQMAATGVAIGFGLYFANRLISAFASAETIPPLVAAWAPSLAGLFAAMAFVSQAEDG
ncbi:MAG TPA: LPS export ABC transporter permease LptG [Caulobacterales bacterium]|nr:LPS export ABC transporter permease LptG [Caulobacterales bacterium]